MNTNELWQAVLGELELQISKANFTTWFRNTFIASFEEKNIVVAVPNTFTKTWLEKKYYKEIQTLIQHFTNRPIRNIVYRVETRQQDPQPIPTEPEKKYTENDP